MCMQLHISQLVQAVKRAKDVIPSDMRITSINIYQRKCKYVLGGSGQWVPRLNPCPDKKLICCVNYDYPMYRMIITSE